MQEELVSGKTSRRRFASSGSRRRGGRRHKGAMKRNVSYSTLMLLSLRCHALHSVKVPCCDIQLQPRYVPPAKIKINLETCLRHLWLPGAAGLVLIKPTSLEHELNWDDVDSIDHSFSGEMFPQAHGHVVTLPSPGPASVLDSAKVLNDFEDGVNVPVPTDDFVGSPELDSILEEPRLLGLWQRFSNFLNSSEWPEILGLIRSTKGIRHRKIWAAGLAPNGTLDLECFLQRLSLSWLRACGRDSLLEAANMADDTSFLDLLLGELGRDIVLLDRALRKPGRLALPKKTCTSGTAPSAGSGDVCVQSELHASTLKFFRVLAYEGHLGTLLESSGFAGGSVRPPIGRQRDVLPLPAADVPTSSEGVNGIVAQLVNLSVLALNRLNGTPGFGSDCTAAHTDILAMLAAKVRSLLVHVDAPDDFQTHAGALEALCGEADSSEPSAKAPSGCRLNADTVDLLPVSGGVDPTPFLPAEARGQIGSICSLFPGGISKLKGFRDVEGADREEYAKLVARQLLARKVDLAFKVSAGGVIFGVGKKDSVRVREVWHGSRVSGAALRPPAPPHLLSPSSLLGLEASADAPLRMSKRDGRCLFDQLRLPAHLRDVMGRPPVRASSLLATGLLDMETCRLWHQQLAG
jgi:hypothetical protein